MPDDPSLIDSWTSRFLGVDLASYEKPQPIASMPDQSSLTCSPDDPGPVTDGPPGQTAVAPPAAAPTQAPPPKDAQECYYMGFRDGQSGAMAVCPANAAADGEASYDRGYADGQAQAHPVDGPGPEVRQPLPSEKVETREITVLSDDKVGTVQKSFTGTAYELDAIEARAQQEINAQQWSNFSGMGENPGEGATRFFPQ